MATATRPTMLGASSSGFDEEDYCPVKQHQETASSSSSSKATIIITTDETVSTADCDSMTASVATASTTNLFLFAPPVANVNVDTRGVRQRLREQEAKINALLHSNKPTSTASSSTTVAAPAPSESVLLKLVKTLEDDLTKTEAEKHVLQEALEQYKQQQEQQMQLKDNTEEEGDDASVESDKPAPREEGLATTTTGATTKTATATEERVAQLEQEVRHKTSHISLLHDRWETTLRRMVVYQCDLETHDLHYTQYAAQQTAAGQEALEELQDLTSKKHQPNKETRQLGKKAKHMMATLLNDLEALGQRYQESRVSHEQQMSEVRLKQGQWQRRAEVLESKLQKGGGVATIAEDDEDDMIAMDAPVMSGPLMKFHEKLRLQQAAALQEQEDLHAKLQAAQVGAQQSQLEKDVLQKELQRLQLTVAQLQEVTQHQQDALQASQAQVDVAQQKVTSRKKKFFSFGSKTSKASPPPPPPHVDVTAALAPMQQESRRFDVLHEQMQAQRQALLRMQTDVHKEMRQKAQLVRTVSALRVEHEQTAALAETAAVMELQAQLNGVVAKREEEQQKALATIEALQARVEALES